MIGSVVGDRRVWRVALTGALVAIVLAAAGCDTGAVTLRGAVSVGAEPAVGAAVIAYADASDTQVAITYTDGDGNYAFSDTVLPPGSYRIRLADGSWHAAAANWADATPVVAASEPATVLDATIAAPAGSISGTLTRGSGRPILGATVEAVSTTNADQVLATATTDATGSYALTGLSAGGVRVRFAASGYAPRYHGGDHRPSSATPIDTNGSAAITGVDAVLDPDGALTGRFVGWTGAWSAVTVVAIDVETGVAAADAPIAFDGTFTIVGLPAGTYTVGLVDPEHRYRWAVIGATSEDPAAGTQWTVARGATTAIGQHNAIGADCPVGAKGSDLSGAAFSGAYLTGCDFSGSSLIGADLSHADLRGATFSGAKLNGADLTGAVLDQATFFVADLSNAVLAGTSTNATNFTGASLAGTNFGGTSLGSVRSNSIVGSPVGLPASWSVISGYLVGPRANLVGANLAGLDLSGRDLHGASLAAAKLTGTNLSGADLSGASLWSADLTGAMVSGANLANVSLSFVKSGGVIGTPAVLDERAALIDGVLVAEWTTVSGLDVTGLDLSSVNLAGITSNGLVGTPAMLPAGWAVVDGTFFGPGATVTGADVSGVDLSQVALANVVSGGLVGTPTALPAGWVLHNGYLVGPRANLRNAALAGLVAPGIDLANVALQSADLTGADLSGANLTTAHLDAANLTGADLSGADLTQAILPLATVTDVDLTGATLVKNYSYGLVGAPAVLPPGRCIVNGYLLTPGAEIFGADLSGADLSGLDLSGVALVRGDLSGANLTGATFTEAQLEGVDLSGATVTGTVFTDATLTAAVGTGLIGAPAALPAEWAVIGGILYPPNG